MSCLRPKAAIIKTEILAGLTTFLTMVYIAFVNPTILADAGMDRGAVFTATCLVTALACGLNGIFAKIPIAIAPGMALNIYFTYSVVQGLGIDWQHALAMVFLSGLLFLFVSLTPLRRLLTESIPSNLQIAILIGISLLIGLISLQTNHIIIDDGHRMMHLGNLSNPESLLFFAGFMLILVLEYYRVRGAIIISILSISAVSLLLGLTSWQGFLDFPPSIRPTWLQLNFSGLSNTAALKAIFTFFLITVFDATGTLIGLLNHPLFKDRPDYLKRFSLSLSSDAIASSIAGLLGSSSTSPYLESATGINAGGKTGLTSIVVAFCFLLMLFLYPLAMIIPHFAVGPALLYVACCMMKHVSELKLISITETAPCMLTIMMIPYTSSIADGIGAGIVVYTLLKLFTREKISLLLLILSIIFVVFFLVS